MLKNFWKKMTIWNTLLIIFVYILILIIVLALVTGCGTLMHGPTQDVYVTSDPPGAVVTNLDYTCWIRTPGVMKLKRANSTVLTAKLFQYETQKKKLQVHISPFILGNGTGLWYTVQTFTQDANGGAVLLIGDMTTGSIGYLTPDSIHFVFEPDNGRIRR